MRRFRKTYIEITNACNRSCSFCPGSSRPVRFMDEALFTLILGKIRLYSKLLYLHVMGEPLLHPQIGRFLERCGASGFQVNLTTNGTLIREAGETILSSPAVRQVSFSLHSFGANEHNGSLDEYLDPIFSFARVAQKRLLPVSLKLWTCGDHAEGNRRILQKIENEFELSRPLDDRPTVAGTRLEETIFLNRAAPFAWPGVDADDQGEQGFCLGLRDQIAILVDGTVVPCCLDAGGVISLGNIQEKDMREILSDPRAAAMYLGFSQRRVVERLCRACTYRKRFDGRLLR